MLKLADSKIGSKIFPFEFEMCSLSFAITKIFSIFNVLIEVSTATTGQFAAFVCVCVIDR